jgi:hypothetical protein
LRNNTNPHTLLAQRRKGVGAMIWRPNAGVEAASQAGATHRPAYADSCNGCSRMPQRRFNGLARRVSGRTPVARPEFDETESSKKRKRYAQAGVHQRNC